MLHIGLAGLGIHGIRYAKPLLEDMIRGARLAAVSRQDERAGREFAEMHGIVYVKDPRELATLPGLDAVVLVLPPDLHLEAASACLDAGRPVLVEKPLANDAPSAAILARRAARSQTPLMVGHTLRFDPLVVSLREQTTSIGPIRLVAINQRFEPTDRPWIDEPGRGGAILNTGVHGFDLLRHFTGAEPVSVQAEMQRVVTRQTEDQFAAVLRLEPGGILATVDNARTTLGRSGRIEIVGADAQLCGDHIHRTLVRIEGRGETVLGPIPAVPTVLEVLRAFVRCLNEGEPIPVTAVDGLAAVRIAEAAAVSARLGERVFLDEIDGGDLLPE